MALQIQAKGFEKLKIRLDKLDLATDVEETLDLAGAFILNQIKTRFLNQEATDGSTWPVSQGAIFRKKTGRDGGTLFDSGTLFESIQLGRGGAGVRTIFTEVPYGPDHQFGLDNNPVREFLGISPSDEQGVDNIIALRIRIALK